MRPRGGGEATDQGGGSLATQETVPAAPTLLSLSLPLSLGGSNSRGARGGWRARPPLGRSPVVGSLRASNCRVGCLPQAMTQGRYVCGVDDPPSVTTLASDVSEVTVICSCHKSYSYAEATPPRPVGNLANRSPPAATANLAFVPEQSKIADFGTVVRAVEADESLPSCSYSLGRSLPNGRLGLLLAWGMSALALARSR
jgi:hypothetical protein